MKTRKNTFLFLLMTLIMISCGKKEEVTPDNTSTGTGTGTGTGTTISGNEVNATVMLDLINQTRTAGCVCGTTNMPPVAALKWNTKLEDAAYKHSLDMKTKNYFDHNNKEGQNPGARITQTGYSWSTYGENIALGYTTEKAVMDGWIKSEGHCKNIMNGSFTEVGVGRSGNYWTQVFAKPK